MDHLQLFIGFAAAILSAVFNGSFTSGFKIKHVADCSLHPIWFTFYVSIGVVISSIFPVVFLLQYNSWIINDDKDNATQTNDNNLNFVTLFLEPMGLIAGSLFVLAIAFSFLAIQYIGVALGQGLWCGCAILVSFCWGAFIFHDEQIMKSSWTQKVIAICLLVLGVFIMAFCETIGKKLNLDFFDMRNSNNDSTEYANNVGSLPLIMQNNNESDNDDDDHPAAGTPESLTDDVDQPVPASYEACNTSTALDVPTPSNVNSSNDGNESFILGFLCALCVGITGGSILAPMHYVPIEKSGLIFLPSFGVGVGISSPIITLISLLIFVKYQQQNERLHSGDENTNGAVELTIPVLHVNPCLWVGIASGILWNVSNILAMIAIPRIGYAIAYPLLQCALFISGLLGIFIFQEIQNPSSINAFFIGGFILICGAILLST